MNNWLKSIFNRNQAEPEGESSLAQEAGLPDSWHPVDSAPIVPSASPSRPNPMATFFAGPISPTLQHDKTFVDTQLGTYNVAKLPLVPLSSSGQPSVGAAVQSGSTTTINNSVNAVAGGPNGSIQFNNAGALAGSALLVWDNINNVVRVGGSVNITGSLVITGNITAAVFNATTGFQIAGTAPTGQYLRGNGTDFVSAVLNGSDIAAGLVPILHGGTGTATPALVQGNDITITGSWPNNTIAVKVQAGVTPGSYTSANLTVDAQGIITAVANGSSGPVITSANLLTQTANVSATNLVASATDGTYIVTVYLVVSQAATTSSNLPDSRIIYTDNQSGATITVPLTSGLTTNTTSTFAQATFIVNAKSATAIQYDIGQTSAYASVGGTVMQFAYHAMAVFLN